MSNLKKKRQRRSLLDSDEEEDVNPLADKTRPSNLEKSSGKSLSEALISASTNPQHDDRLLIELQVHYMNFPCSNLGKTCCVQKFFLTFRTIFVHNMFSPCSKKKSFWQRFTCNAFHFFVHSVLKSSFVFLNVWERI